MFTSKRPTEIKKPEPSGNGFEAPAQTILIPTKNFVLAALTSLEVQNIVEESKAVRFTAGQEIYAAGDRIIDVYFPVDCVVSSLALFEDGSTVEISMIGREGIVGLAAIVGGGRSHHFTRVSAEGTALRISTVTLQSLFARQIGVQTSVLRAYRRMFTQVAQRSVCNTRHSLLQRLCVWLLMVHDRISSDHLPFTQEDIANRISVRRAGVSVAASMLQSMRAISYQRGQIVIIDRDVLEHTACECYEVLRAEFQQQLKG